MSNTIRIGHCQMQVVPGDFKANLARMIPWLEEAQRRRLAIVSFPESVLTGYYDTAEGFRAPGHNFTVDSPQMTEFLRRTAGYDSTIIVGFTEMRHGDIYNSALIAERGQLKGLYSKAFPCSRSETPGREFRVFERDGVTFGVIICADGGFIEPSRIVALKGARIIFAPHFNYIKAHGLLTHFTTVRSDHTARAIENGVWFLRGNNVVVPGKESLNTDPGLGYEADGYGESYLINPLGQVVVRSLLHCEQMIDYEVNLDLYTDLHNCRSLESGRALGHMVIEALDQARPGTPG